MKNLVKNGGDVAKVVDLFNNKFGIHLGEDMLNKYDISEGWTNDIVANVLNDIARHMKDSFSELENTAHAFSVDDDTVTKLTKVLNND